MYFKNQSFKKISLAKFGLPMKYFFGNIQPILDTEKWLWNFQICDMVVYDLGKSDEVIIKWKNAYFQ